MTMPVPVTDADQVPPVLTHTPVRSDGPPCLIVECSEVETWPGLKSRIPGGSPRLEPDEPLLVPQQHRPSALQPDLETAEAEAQRLARVHAGKVFVIFKAVAAAKVTLVPSHTTLGGKTTGEKPVAVLLDIGEDDGIPF